MSKSAADNDEVMVETSQEDIQELIDAAIAKKSKRARLDSKVERDVEVDGKSYVILRTNVPNRRDRRAYVSQYNRSRPDNRKRRIRKKKVYGDNSEEE